MKVCSVSFAMRAWLNTYACVAGLACLALAGGAHAQALPDAGRIQQQLEQSIPPPASTPLDPLPAEQPASAQDQPRIVLHQVIVEGAQLIPAAELEQVFVAHLNQPVALDTLQRTAQSLVALYRQRGWFARVTLPAQDVSGGVLRVQVVEARFGTLHLAPGATRANADFVARMVGGHLQEGQHYSMDDLERGLLLANDLSGIQADGVLKAGSAPGSSDLALTVRDTAWLSGQLSAGNQGSRTTGYAQAVGQLALNDLSGYGDQIRLTGVRAEDLDYVQLGYATPLGTDGLRLDLDVSRLNYRLGKEFEDLDAEGRFDVYQVGLSYPLTRLAARNLWVSFGLAHRDSRDEVLGTVVRERDVDSATLSLYGDQRSEQGGSAFSWRLDLSQGEARLQRADDRASDQDGPRIAGSFTRLNGNALWDQWLAPAWYLRVRGSGQWAPNNLDSSQQFSLGGMYGVRGYPTSEGAGDSGALMQLEVHRLLGDLGLPGFEAYAFLDGGVVRQHHSLWSGWNTAESEHNTYALYASGLGLRWSHASGLGLDAVLAAPLGSNPGTGDGHNQDGSRKGPRGWLTATYTF